MWLKPIYILLICVSLGYWFTRRLTGLRPASKKKITVPVSVILIVVMWVVQSGVGGFGHQYNDYNKHNAVISDLTKRSIPVEYAVGPQREPLVYYVAYYLPGALIGRVADKHVGVSKFGMLIWTLLGMTLVICWLKILLGNITWLLSLCFIFFSGLDIIGYILFGSASPWGGVVEWYFGPANLHYSSMTTMLFWGPQLALPAWLSTMMVVNTTQDEIKELPLLGASLLLWGPFVLLGVIPFILVKVLWRGVTGLLATFFTYELICAICVSVPAILYLVSGNITQPRGLYFTYGPEDFWMKALKLVTFILLEFGVYGLLILPALRSEDKQWRRCVAAAVISLSILPLFRYGFVNDLVTKTSLPGLAVICIAVLKVLANQHMLSLRRYSALVAVLAVASIAPLLDVRSHLYIGTAQRADAWGSIESATKGLDARYAQQYIGRRDSFFFRKIAR